MIKASIISCGLPRYRLKVIANYPGGDRKSGYPGVMCRCSVHEVLELNQPLEVYYIDKGVPYVSWAGGNNISQFIQRKKNKSTGII